MKSFQIILATALLAVLMVPNIARADDIWLKNGDRIKGVVITMEAGKLILKTSFAGDLAIDWSEVANLRTDAPVKVLFSDGTSIQGEIISGKDGTINMRSPQLETPLTFQLARVKGINPPAPGPPVKLSGQINTGINITDGNTDTKNYYGDAELVARTEENRFTLGGRYNFAEDNGDTTANNQTVYIKYDHFLNQKWYFLVNAAGTKDSFKDLNLRSSIGLGLGYQFLETETTNLSVELGTSYVNEDYISADDESYAAGRWSVNFDHLLYKDLIQFFHKHVGLVSLADTSKTSLQSQTGFRFKIYRGLTANVQMNLDWDNRPAPGVENTDTAYVLTLGYHF